MENNLLDKFKFGDKLREQFRQGVYLYLPAEKAKYLEVIATISAAGAADYLEQIEQALLFRASASRPKFDLYSNQPTKCFNWVCVPTSPEEKQTDLDEEHQAFVSSAPSGKAATAQGKIGR